MVGMASLQHLAVPTEDGPIHVVHEGDGPHLVLLHPGGLDLTVWDDLSKQLAKTHHVVRFDARSHGRSATSHTDHSPALDVIRVLDALAIDRAHLLGCSMGAVTATEVAVRQPERVCSLALIGGEVWPDDHDSDPFLSERKAEMDQAIAKADGELWIEAMLRATVDGPYRSPEESQQETRRSIAQLLTRSIQLHSTAAGRQTWTPVRHRLNEIAVPTLVLVGDQDSLAVNTTAQLIEKEVRNVRCVRLLGTGHLAMIEAPEVTLAEITAHLGQGRPDSAEETCVREPLIQ